MKVFTFIAMAFFIIPFARAEENGGGMAEMMKEGKEERLKMIDERIAGMQKHRACIAGANSKDEMKKCHEEMKTMHEHMKGEAGEMREKMKEKRQEMRKKHKGEHHGGGEENSEKK